MVDLPRGAEPGEPDGDALLAEQPLAVLAGDGAGVPGDVGGFLFGHGDERFRGVCPLSRSTGRGCKRLAFHQRCQHRGRSRKRIADASPTLRHDEALEHYVVAAQGEAATGS